MRDAVCIIARKSSSDGPKRIVRKTAVQEIAIASAVAGAVVIVRDLLAWELQRLPSFGIRAVGMGLLFWGVWQLFTPAVRETFRLRRNFWQQSLAIKTVVVIAVGSVVYLILATSLLPQLAPE